MVQVHPVKGFQIDFPAFWGKRDTCSAINNIALIVERLWHKEIGTAVADTQRTGDCESCAVIIAEQALTDYPGSP